MLLAVRRQRSRPGPEHLEPVLDHLYSGLFLGFFGRDASAAALCSSGVPLPSIAFHCLSVVRCPPLPSAALRVSTGGAPPSAAALRFSRGVAALYSLATVAGRGRN